MYNILKSKTELLNQQAVAFAAELVKTPSLSLAEALVAGLVERKMNELAFDKVFRDDAGNVVGVLFGRDAEPTVLLNSHLDTMPPGDESQWTDSPCSGRITDGKLYGLGAGDCKAGLAAQIFAVALLKRSLLPLRGNLIVAATVGEETGGSVGIQTLIQHTLPQLNLKPTYALLGEPTDLGLYYGHDGWAELQITIEGPNIFDVDDAAQAIHADFTHRRPDQDRQDFHTTVPDFQQVNGFRRATIALNRRLKDTEELPVLVNEVKHHAALVAGAVGNVAVDVMVRQENRRLYNGRTTVARHLTHAWAIDPFHPLMERSRQALAAAGCSVRPGKWKLGRLGMGTAGSLLVNEFHIPTLGFGPGCEDLVHAPNEFVSLDNLTNALYATAAITHALIGIPVFGWTSEQI